MYFEAPPLTGQGKLTAGFQSTKPWVHVAANDRTFNCLTGGGQGVLKGTGELSGTLYTGNLGTGLLTGTGQLSGTMIPGVVAYGLLTGYGSLSADFYILYKKVNWVGWSKIGDTRILLDESNEAGYRPLPGRATGYVHAILPYLDKLVVVYGDTGVFVLQPVAQPHATFGFKTLSNIGVYGPGAVCGDNEHHFFINKAKQLCEVVTVPNAFDVRLLGYEEFIEQLTPNDEIVLLHRDPNRKRVYISSAIGGFIYTSQGLGGGYAKLTHADGSIFSSDAAVSSPAQEIVTDIIDFKLRGIKALESVAVGTNLTENLYVAVDYRYDYQSTFQTTAWMQCNKEGVVYPTISAVEFRIRIKTDTYDDFELDYLHLNYKIVDKRSSRVGYFRDITLN